MCHIFAIYVSLEEIAGILFSIFAKTGLQNTAHVDALSLNTSRKLDQEYSQEDL